MSEDVRNAGTPLSAGAYSDHELLPRIPWGLQKPALQVQSLLEAPRTGVACPWLTFLLSLSLETPSLSFPVLLYVLSISSLAHQHGSRWCQLHYVIPGMHRDNRLNVQQPRPALDRVYQLACVFVPQTDNRRGAECFSSNR